MFRNLVAEIAEASERITLYASRNDRALALSKRFNGLRRAGDATGGVIIVDGIDTIDASAVDTSLIGHSYYGDNRSVLSDMFSLLRSRNPPPQRFGLRPARFAGSSTGCSSRRPPAGDRARPVRPTRSARHVLASAGGPQADDGR